MLHISWASFLKAVMWGLLIYYLIIGYVFFRKELAMWIRKRIP